MSNKNKKPLIYAKSAPVEQEIQNKINIGCDRLEYHLSKEYYRNATAMVTNNIIKMKDVGNVHSCIEKIENEIGIKYASSQKEAFNVLKKSGIKIITGGPGTGKTTLLNGCIKCYAEMYPSAQIKLFAPTGCAAEKMQQSTGYEATTAHKMLRMQKYDLFKFAEIRPEKIQADLFIMDESSMADIYMFRYLLCAIPNGATILLLGDSDQLPSVDAGNVLYDLINSGKIEYYKLDTVFRQKGENLIVSNAKAVINGNPDLKTDKNFRIISFEDEIGMINELDKIAKNAKKDFQIFTPSRRSKFATGTVSLNKKFHAIKKEADIEARYGEYIFSVNDKVIFNMNNYEKGYYNGEKGVITDVQILMGTAHVTVQTETGPINLSGIELADIELGYAITAHKAQGSECDNALIFVPLKPQNMLQRNLLYVEITRAKKQVVMLVEKDALKKCINNANMDKRDTGLKYFLQNSPAL